MSTLESAIESTEELIELALNEIWIYDGHFDPKIYQSERIVKQIQEAVVRGVNIGVICDESVQIENPVILDLIKQGKISIHRANLDKRHVKYSSSFLGHYSRKNYPRPHIDAEHCMVVDKSHMRWEEPHQVESATRRAVIKYMDRQAKRYAEAYREYASA